MPSGEHSPRSSMDRQSATTPSRRSGTKQSGSTMATACKPHPETALIADGAGRCSTMPHRWPSEESAPPCATVFVGRHLAKPRPGKDAPGHEFRNSVARGSPACAAHRRHARNIPELHAPWKHGACSLVRLRGRRQDQLSCSRGGVRDLVPAKLSEKHIDFFLVKCQYTFCSQGKL